MIKFENTEVMGWESVNIIGRLTRDPELRKTADSTVQDVSEDEIRELQRRLNA